mmetsp:Transcript_22681/g.40735  ORF Transcript_22681/g.40735 Transcript_22681/m.40735 type:complete len:227 (+) Transcript_22681:1237-1917(+)
MGRELEDARLDFGRVLIVGLRILLDAFPTTRGARIARGASDWRREDTPWTSIRWPSLLRCDSLPGEQLARSSMYVRMLWSSTSLTFRILLWTTLATLPHMVVTCSMSLSFWTEASQMVLSRSMARITSVRLPSSQSLASITSVPQCANIRRLAAATSVLLCHCASLRSAVSSPAAVAGRGMGSRRRTTRTVLETKSSKMTREGLSAFRNSREGSETTGGCPNVVRR